MQICTRCIYDSNVPGISFDDKGVCSYCKLHVSLDRQYPTGAQGQAQLKQMAEAIRRAGMGRPYDCVVGVSGGCDSSYLLHLAVELGLRPLAVHFDNTWNSSIATQNIQRMTKALNVDLDTHIVNNKEYDDLYRSMIKSGVSDIEAPTDLAISAVLRTAASKNNIKYILEGHSFRTEGISPLGWLYMDARYVDAIHRRYGSRPLETYPHLWLSKQIKWWVVDAFQFVRPLYHVDYHKEDAKKLLTEKYGWEWYGGHHLDNRFTAFYHRYFIPVRFGLDFRVLGYSALVRSGQMSRQEALEEMKTPPHDSQEIKELVQYVQKRLGYSDNEFTSLMNAPKRHWTEFPNYSATFRRLKPLLWLLMKADRIPRSFYMKYTREI